MNSVGLETRLMIDCSHANSRKDHRRQTEVADAIGHQVEAGNRAIRGVMIESFLVEGRQNHVPGEKLTFGQSITDACVDIPTTEGMLKRLARATKIRRNRAFA